MFEMSAVASVRLRPEMISTVILSIAASFAFDAVVLDVVMRPVSGRDDDPAAIAQQGAAPAVEFHDGSFVDDRLINRRPESFAVRTRSWLERRICLQRFPLRARL